MKVYKGSDIGYSLNSLRKELDSILDTKILFSQKTKNILKKNNLIKFGDIARLKIDEFFNLNIGKDIYIQLNNLLEVNNLSWDMDIDHLDWKSDNDLSVITKSNLKKRIDEFDLSVRLKNGIRAGGFVYLGHLVSISEEDFLKQRYIGKVTLKEAKDLLHKNFLYFM